MNISTRDFKNNIIEMKQTKMIKNVEFAWRDRTLKINCLLYNLEYNAV
jgi:hypothetical protein